MSKELVREARERAEKATEGPWFASKAMEYDPKQRDPFHDQGATITTEGTLNDPYDRLGDVVQGGLQDEQGGAVGVLRNQDAEFIAWAREGVPALCDALDEANEHIRELEEQVRKNLCSWCKGTGRLGLGEVNPKQTTMPNHEGPITMTATCYRCGGTGFRQDDGRCA